MSHGTPGERDVQSRMGTQTRANNFYERNFSDTLSDKMVELIGRQEMVFVATADADGNCDCSPRFGSAGFVIVLDEKTLAYPEYRGNGVFASLGNIVENPHAGLVFIDFLDTTVGLHVNGVAGVHQVPDLPPTLAAYIDNELPDVDSVVQCWVVITIDEAYIHCSKHVPLLEKKNKQIMWGTDDPLAKSVDYFQADSEPT